MEREVVLLWESVACALEHVADLPYAWGIASVLSNARSALAAAGAAPAAPAAAVVVARWLSRAVADAFFVPLDECSGLVAWASAKLFLDSGQEPNNRWGQAGGGAPSTGTGTAGWPTDEELVTCARGWSFFYLILIDRFELGMGIDDAVGALLSTTTTFGGGVPRLVLHLLKLAVSLGCPAGGNEGYFVNLQLEAAFAVAAW